MKDVQTSRNSTLVDMQQSEEIERGRGFREDQLGIVDKHTKIQVVYLSRSLNLTS